MDRSDFQRVEQLFQGAVALPPAQRAAHVRAEAGDDAALIEKVERLLAHADHQTAGVRFEPDAAPARPGQVIGRYKVLEQIGEGGFGVVYMAEQLGPVQRRVALKIIKLGMDTMHVIGLF